jgi:PPM family protein phosphatase
MPDTATDPALTPVDLEHAGPVQASPLRVRSFGQTDRGRVRGHNEDCLLVAELRKAMVVRQSNLPHPDTQYGDERGHLFLVADGMGGHRGGEQASALAVMTIEEFVLNTFKWFFELRGPEGQQVLVEFQRALREADVRLNAEMVGRPELYGMGTTLTMAYVFHGQLFVAHVGDSRCYLLREGTLYRLTSDHTLVADLVRSGQISPEEAGTHRLRHVITNVVGGGRSGVRVEVHKTNLQAGDVVLVCSDGLTEMVSEGRIAQVLAEEPDPRRACGRLVAEANERGGTDNVSVIVARFDPEAQRGD